MLKRKLGQLSIVCAMMSVLVMLIIQPSLPLVSAQTVGTPSPTVQLAPTYTPAPTYTALPTYTPPPTYTPYPTYTPPPTATPTATPQLPPPLTDPTMVAIVREWRVGSSFTHSSGQFTVADIPSWDRSQRGSFGDARVIFSNSWMNAFVQVWVVESANIAPELRDWLDYDTELNLWGGYDLWLPLGYTDDGETLVADYALSFRGLPFIGRMVLMQHEGYLVNLVIVVPANAQPLLYLIQKLLMPTIIVHPDGVNILSP